MHKIFFWGVICFLFFGNIAAPSTLSWGANISFSFSLTLLLRCCQLQSFCLYFFYFYECYHSNPGYHYCAYSIYNWVFVITGAYMNYVGVRMFGFYLEPNIVCIYMTCWLISISRLSMMQMCIFLFDLLSHRECSHRYFLRAKTHTLKNLRTKERYFSIIASISLFHWKVIFSFLFLIFSSIFLFCSVFFALYV